MGAISYAFENVPFSPDFAGLTEEQQTEATAAFRRRIAGVYADLGRRGLEVPQVPVEQITRDQLVAHLQGVVGRLVELEVTGNRDLYEALDDGQAALVLRRLAVLEGVPYAPNLLSPEDVAAARAG